MQCFFIIFRVVVVMEKLDESVCAQFGKLKSIDELTEFLDSIQDRNSFCKALCYYARIYLSRAGLQKTTQFEPGAFLSHDFSAILYDRFPVIFMGTNAWCLKPLSSVDELMDKMSIFYNQLSRLRTLFGSIPVYFLVVPEKDRILNSLYFNDNRFEAIDNCLFSLKNRLLELDVHCFYEDIVQSQLGKDSSPEYGYFDSHLPSSVYVDMFSMVMQKIDSNFNDRQQVVEYEKSRLYGDLVCKFGAKTNPGEDFSFPLVGNAEAKLVSGDETFRQPLGETKQFFYNKNARLQKKLLLLGDSHSSIYSQKKLTYLFSNYFEETFFYWNPVGVRGNDFITDVDCVILEISQRFVF